MKCSLFKTIEKRKRTMMTPRVAAIHDMSGFGRCSLTVAIPILSAMGVQCCPLPTAFLSTHTGGFEGFTFLDMTDEMSKVADHWASLGLTFQAYTAASWAVSGRSAWWRTLSAGSGDRTPWWWWTR